MISTAFCCCTATMALWSGRAIPIPYCTARPLVAGRARGHRSPCRMGQFVGPHLQASGSRGGAGLWELLGAGSGVPLAVSARVRETERTAVGEALHPAEHRPHPTGV